MAQSGRTELHCTCPLLGVKRTCLLHRKCPLMTQSGHQPPHALIFSVASLNRYNALS